MRYRTFRFLDEDDMRGVTNHQQGELINRFPLSLVSMVTTRKTQQANGRNAAASRMAKGLLGKLGRLGIK